MLTAESSGSVLTNVTPLESDGTDVNSGGVLGVARQPARARASARSLRKGRQYSVKTFISLGITLLCVALPTDARALYALAELERASGSNGSQGRYAEQLRQVLTRAPANLAVRLQLADVLLALGESDSTLRYLEDVRPLRPEAPREA